MANKRPVWLRFYVVDIDPNLKPIYSGHCNKGLWSTKHLSSWISDLCLAILRRTGRPLKSELTSLVIVTKLLLFQLKEQQLYGKCMLKGCMEVFLAYTSRGRHVLNQLIVYFARNSINKDPLLVKVLCVESSISKT